MHTELIKHKMRDDGEDNIYDTAGMAICLGVVQNYTFEEDTATKVWKLIRKENPDEDGKRTHSTTTPSPKGAEERAPAKCFRVLPEARWCRTNVYYWRTW